jgi:hypothetical protein
MHTHLLADRIVGGTWDCPALDGVVDECGRYYHNIKFGGFPNALRVARYRILGAYQVADSLMHRVAHLS